METTFQKKSQRQDTAIIQKKRNPFFGKMAIQKKLTIGAANDVYEIEADRVADQVVGMSDTQVQTKPQTGALIQRKCAACEQEEKLQMKPLGDTITPLIQKSSMSSGNESTASEAVTNQINSSKGGGKSMGASTQSYMESRFGTDFSGVKIHTDSSAIQLSRDLNAQAFTVGNDIYFNEGKYNPSNSEGKHLLAHELTHTIQQGGIKRKMIQRSPSAIALTGAALLGFITGYGLAFAADYLSMTRARSLRFARSMGTGWLRSLPDCPCTAPLTDRLNWEQDSNPNLSHYHPGATYSFRSTKHSAPGRHGQQCTYDTSKNLIKSGAGAGTPDYYSPSDTFDIPYHVVYDVKTWDELGSSTYNRYWQPNVGVGCP